MSNGCTIGMNATSYLGKMLNATHRRNTLHGGDYAADVDKLYSMIYDDLAVLRLHSNNNKTVI